MSESIVVSLGCGFIAVAFALWSHLAGRRMQAVLAARLAKCEHDLTTAMSGAIGMGSRIVHLEKKLHQVSVAQSSAAEAEGALYTQAMQLFDSGADINAVVASCGISSSEANLMALIRRKTLRPTAVEA